jgi:hypothetical protein
MGVAVAVGGTGVAVAVDGSGVAVAVGAAGMSGHAMLTGLRQPTRRAMAAKTLVAAARALAHAPAPTVRRKMVRCHSMPLLTKQPTLFVSWMLQIAACWTLARCVLPIARRRPARTARKYPALAERAAAPERKPSWTA